MGEIMAVLTRWELDAGRVRERMYRAPTPRERERWHALWLLAQGWSANKVAELLERDAHTIGAWLAAFDRDGPAALAFEQTGGPPALDPDVQAGLKVAVQAAPSEVGIDLANWNWKVVRQFIAIRCGIQLCRSACTRYLHRLGFVCKRPQKRLLKADEAKRAAFVADYATLHALLDHIVGLARQRTVTRGRKLRIDGTVVETNIHHPTDSTLLYDGVRVLSRTLAKAKGMLQDPATLAADACQDRTRSAKRQMKRIMEAARQRGEQAEQALQGAYRRLVAITETVRERAQATDGARRIAATLDHDLPLVEQIIAQTTRRVLHGEAVPANEKLVSLFEPHTAIIRKGKPGRPTPFGRVLWLDEVEGGIISRYEVLQGNPPEPAQLPRSLDHHRALFTHPPHLLAGDRGSHSSANERYATDHGVAQVVLPKPGAKSARRIAHEQQRWFRRGHDWRSGLEGRISGLKRRHKLDRCRNHGDDGMERWVGWGLIAHDLRVIAAATAR